VFSRSNKEQYAGVLLGFAELPVTKEFVSAVSISDPSSDFTVATTSWIPDLFSRSLSFASRSSAALRRHDVRLIEWRGDQIDVINPREDPTRSRNQQT